MKIVSIGGGPAGLYFAILMKRLDPSHEIRVVERNQPDDTFGFGVVFSDKTMSNLADEDPESYRAITDAFWHWDDIHTFYGGRKLVSTGHGFAGMSRQKLLTILQNRCRELGVEMKFGVEVSDLSAYGDADLILGADGVNSTIRELYKDDFQPVIDWRPNRFVWLGTSVPYEAFTFYFKENEHGMYRVHAYRYEPGASTFIVECTGDTFERSGLAVEDEDATIAYMEKLFAEELAGHKLLKNRSHWRQFPTIRCRHWSRDNVVLMGDAVHTAHFSIGSGTKLAMEDCIALRAAIREQPNDLPAALASYEQTHRPATESLQRAAQVSLEWFENTERYMHLDPTQFHVSLLTRSLRVTHDNLKLRDPKTAEEVEQWFAAEAAAQSGRDVPASPAPPMFAPFKLRDLVLDNRMVVSPMCMYSADDGTVGDWHLVHLGSRAIGGAGLVFTEMTDVSADARISPGCAGMYKPEHVGAWKKIVEFVHANSRAKIGMQLGHAGRKGSTQRLWEQPDMPLPDGNWPLIAASAIPYTERNQTPKAMDRADMDRVRDDFVRAANMANEAGFDMLELHYAHGYLFASFISPLTNRRDDEYGGDVAGRMKFPLEVFDAVRAAWPGGKPMSVRISASDWAPGGLTPEDSVAIGRLLRRHGCDIVDVSCGQTVPNQKPVYGRLFQTPFSERIRLEAEVPTMTVGNVTSYEDVNSILVAGRADLVVAARAHLWDPYLTRHAARAMGYDLPWPNQYRAAKSFNPRFE